MRNCLQNLPCTATWQRSEHLKRRIAHPGYSISDEGSAEGSSRALRKVFRLNGNPEKRMANTRQLNLEQQQVYIIPIKYDHGTVADWHIAKD